MSKKNISVGQDGIVIPPTKEDENYNAMLNAKGTNELAAATGFPKDYKFTGTKVEVVKQIGNAVPPNFAKAMFSQILSEMTA